MFVGCGCKYSSPLCAKLEASENQLIHSGIKPHLALPSVRKILSGLARSMPEPNALQSASSVQGNSLLVCEGLTLNDSLPPAYGR